MFNSTTKQTNSQHIFTDTSVQSIQMVSQIFLSFLFIFVYFLFRLFFWVVRSRGVGGSVKGLCGPVRRGGPRIGGQCFQVTLHAVPIPLLVYWYHTGQILWASLKLGSFLQLKIKTNTRFVSNFIH